MRSLKVGDKIKVINGGAVFSGYEIWIDKYAPKYKDKWNNCYIRNYRKDDSIGEVVVVGNHTAWNELLYGILINDEFLIIGERGIELA